MYKNISHFIWSQDTVFRPLCNVRYQLCSPSYRSCGHAEEELDKSNRLVQSQTALQIRDSHWAVYYTICSAHCKSPANKLLEERKASQLCNFFCCWRIYLHDWIHFTCISLCGTQKMRNDSYIIAITTEWFKIIKQQLEPYFVIHHIRMLPDKLM